MEIWQVVVLSLIQGLTEFLPVSSSAHLILPSKLLGWADQGLAFDVCCHAGTLMAVVIYYRERLVRICREFFRGLGLMGSGTESSVPALSPEKTSALPSGELPGDGGAGAGAGAGDPAVSSVSGAEPVSGGFFRRFWQRQSPDARMGWFVLLSTVPVCLAGLLLHHVIEDFFRDHAELVIALTTILFGLLLWVADRHCQKRGGQFSAASMTLMAALIIGLSQILAFIPGTSRSGITITTALFLGMARKDAADYSFLLSIPLIAAAGSYSALKVILSDTTGAADPLSILLGTFLSFVSAYVVIKLFIRYIARTGMAPFVIYRLLLGTGLLILVFSGA